MWGGCCFRVGVPCGVQAREVLGLLLDALLELDEDGEEEAALVGVALELIEHLQVIYIYMYGCMDLSCCGRGENRNSG